MTKKQTNNGNIYLVRAAAGSPFRSLIIEVEDAPEVLFITFWLGFTSESNT